MGGILDVIPDDETGLRVPPGDAGVLAAAIKRAMDDPDALERIAKQGARFAATAFGWDEIVSRLESVYQSAVAARGGT